MTSEPMPATHELKCAPPWFQHVLDGSKRFEVRRNDRNFHAGDRLRLRELRAFGWENDPYTGREQTVRVTYILYGASGLGPIAGAIRDGYVVMGIEHD